MTDTKTIRFDLGGTAPLASFASLAHDGCGCVTLASGIGNTDLDSRALNTIEVAQLAELIAQAQAQLPKTASSSEVEQHFSLPQREVFALGQLGLIARSGNNGYYTVRSLAEYANGRQVVLSMLDQAEDLEAFLRNASTASAVSRDYCSQLVMSAAITQELARLIQALRGVGLQTPTYRYAVLVLSLLEHYRISSTVLTKGQQELRSGLEAVVGATRAEGNWA